MKMIPLWSNNIIKALFIGIKYNLAILLLGPRQEMLLFLFVHQIIFIFRLVKSLQEEFAIQ